MRKKLLLGNWKMNKTISETKEFLKDINELVALAKEKDIDIGIAPTYLCLETIKNNVPSSVIVASQNCHYLDSGAYTGEVSVLMLKELGIDWSIIGHSERRTYDNETNEKCNKKIIKLLANNMIPVYCVGETLAEFEANKTKEVVSKQVREGLANLDATDVNKVVIAYEPVWSIGTGKNASSEIAQDVCHFIREIIKEMYPSSEENVLILYGGSVKPDNIKGYLNQADVDGALVGGASLKIDSFKAMVENLVK